MQAAQAASAGGGGIGGRSSGQGGIDAAADIVLARLTCTAVGMLRLVQALPSAAGACKQRSPHPASLRCLTHKLGSEAKRCERHKRSGGPARAPMCYVAAQQGLPQALLHCTP